MKLRHLCSTMVLVLGLGTPFARAQQYEYNDYSPSGRGPYFRVGLGPSVFQDGRLTGFGGPVDSKVDYDVGFAADMAIGYSFNKFLSTDFEFGGIGTRINSVPGFFAHDTFLDNVPIMGNLTLSLPIPRTIITPYIGAGVGGSWSLFSTDGFGDNNVAVFGDESDFRFGWQAYAGVRFNLNPNMSIGIGYKYFTTEDTSYSYPPAFGPGPNFHVNFAGVKTHSVIISFRATF